MKLCLAGKRGHIHYVFESIRDVPEWEIAGVSATTPEELAVLEDAAGTLGFSAESFSDYRTMLDTVRPDMVAIDGPFERHAEMCLEALRRRIHVFCEKPIAFHLSEVAEMERLASENSLRVMSMAALRYEQAFQAACDMVRSGAIGELRLLQIQKSYKFGTRPDFYRKRASYGGTIPWVGSHGIDLMLAMTDAEVRDIRAVQSRCCNHDTGEMEMTAQCLFGLENGIMASLSIDFLRPESAPTWGDDRVRAAGTKGILEVRGGILTLLDSDGEHTVEMKGPFRRIFSDFAAEISGGPRVLSGNAATFELARLCILAQESADRNQIVTAGGRI